MFDPALLEEAPEFADEFELLELFDERLEFDELLTELDGLDDVLLLVELEPLDDDPLDVLDIDELEEPDEVDDVDDEVDEVDEAELVDEPDDDALLVDDLELADEVDEVDELDVDDGKLATLDSDDGSQKSEKLLGPV